MLYSTLFTTGNKKLQEHSVVGLGQRVYETGGINMERL